MATAKKKVSGIKKSNPTQYADKTIDTYSLRPGSFGWGYEVNKLTSVRKGNKTGKPLTASKDVIYRGGKPSGNKKYTLVNGFKDSYVDIPSVSGTGETGTVVRPGVVGPKTVIRTNASSKYKVAAARRADQIRRGSKTRGGGR